MKTTVDLYFWINCFFTFSLIGYILECIVLTVENRKPVYNRGFGHGPFCIIYGFGAVGAAVLLRPVSDDMVKLYFASMLMATTMELITAKIMIRLFGAFWWDYSRKPFNYKGIICLESSIAWGFLGLFFFKFLNGFVSQLVDVVPIGLERLVALGLLSFYVADFTYTMRYQLKAAEMEEEEGVSVVGRLKVY